MEDISVVKPIPGFDGYFASTEGKVFNKKGKEIRPRLRARNKYPQHRYLIVDLFVNNKRKTVYVHTLVLITYYGNKPSPKHQVRHLDGDKMNNSISNLRWGTPQENTIDKLYSGTYGTKLSVHQVLEIRERFVKNQEKQKTLAKEYGVSNSTISHIINRKSWGYI